MDADGIVYYLLPADWDGQYGESFLVDGPDYEKWRNTYLNGAKEIGISFQKLTEENIAAIGYPQPDVMHPQVKG